MADIFQEYGEFFFIIIKKKKELQLYVLCSCLIQFCLPGSTVKMQFQRSMMKYRLAKYCFLRGGKHWLS